MLYLVEVLDSICYLESRLKEIFEKADTIDVVASRVEELLIQELLTRVDTLEANAGSTGNNEYEDSSSNFVAQMEERVNELDSSQKTLLKMINGMSEDFRATLDVVRNEIADVKVPKPKPFCGVKDAKVSENFISDLKQYFKARNTVTKEAKVTLAMMHLCEDVKLWSWRKLHDLKYTDNIQEYVKQFEGLMLDIRDMLEKDKVFYFAEGLKPWANTKLYEQRVQDLTSAYAAVERLFDLTNDSQEVRRHQSSSPGRNRNSRSCSPKDDGGGKHSGRDRKPYQPNIQNICGGPYLARECPNKVDFHAFQASLTSDSNDNSNQAEGEVDQINGGKKTRKGAYWAEAKHLRLSWEKDLGRMKVVNFVALPIVELVKRTVIKLRGWKGLVDFVVVKMDDFDVVLGMEFLFEHQSNEFQMISAMQLDKSPVQEEPPSAVILLGALGKLGETVPKETPCVSEKCHGFSRSVQASYETPILSLKKKDRNPQRYIKRRILNKLTASCKYPLSILPNLVDRSRGVKYFSMADMQPSLIDAKGGKCCFVPRQINVLGYVVEFHQIEVEMRKITATCDTRIPKLVTELRSCLGLVNSNGQFVEGFLKRRTSSLTELLKEEDIQWGGNLECQAAFDGLKQATIEGPSLKVVDATKPPKVEAEQFNYMLGEYLHHFVDGRQRNSVQMLQPNSITSSNRFADQEKVEEEWEQMANIIRACLEEASRSIEERVDQKRCPLEFEWITKFLINDETMTYGYLST
ncbi:uncharacterized protein E6C27_scaffold22G002820 [Cucumis melo var. makuwa]|uniref:Reverse transcriptase n=1 Tax=Cucumis melo var. makuwa TaxID=1194695 RepID=A0A5A7V3M0_CUCMM|nr:uncharacterized protein E6C27_scaffold22G002820 [Cucumis melo var. makuwa]